MCSRVSRFGPAGSFGAASVLIRRQSRSAKPANMHSLHLVHKPVIAIVGGESLLGKDIRELLEESDLKAEVKLIAADAEEGSIITPGPDEPIVMAPLLFADL